MTPRLRAAAAWWVACVGGLLGLNPTVPAHAGQAAFDVRAYGAIGDGRHLETAAINATIDACTQAGGGRVYVPPGRYLTGTVVLKSNVTFELEAGATLLGSENPEDYSAVDAAGERQPMMSLIYAVDAERITITGRGTIDGQGLTWWRRFRINRKPPAQRTPAEQTQALPVPWMHDDRPYLLRPIRCRDLTVEHVTLRNAAFHTLQPVQCERVRIDDLTIFAEKGSLNTDGISLQACRNIQITNCRIDTGDDCIVPNSGMNQSGRRLDRPSEDITISNCVMYRGHGGIVVGSTTSGGIRNLTVSNCVFHGTDIGVRIKSQRGRGGVVEGISVSNVVMHDVPTPFMITTFYAGSDTPEDELPVAEGTPRYRDFLFSNITARGAEIAGAVIGLREMPIENITFSNVHIQSATGFSCTNARGIIFLDTVIDAAEGPTLTLKNTTDIETSRLRTRLSRDGRPVVLTLPTGRSAPAPLAEAAPTVTPTRNAAVPPLTSRPAGQTRTIPEVGTVLVRVPPGTFLMGSPASEANRDYDEEPRTQVIISHEFWLGQYEVTQREWLVVMGRNPSRFKGEYLPVEQVSWLEAMEFCRKLTERERTAGRLPANAEFTLPTEAQWEYACRAGTQGSYGGSDVLDTIGWSPKNAGKTTHKVGQKLPNAWGFSDMHGNVWEWCRDWKGNYPGGSVTDPTGPENGTMRVHRGGSWNPYDPGNCRSAYRNWFDPMIRIDRIGFRIALIEPSNHVAQP